MSYGCDCHTIGTLGKPLHYPPPKCSGLPQRPPHAALSFNGAQEMKRRRGAETISWVIGIYRPNGHPSPAFCFSYAEIGIQNTCLLWIFFKSVELGRSPYKVLSMKSVSMLINAQNLHFQRVGELGLFPLSGIDLSKGPLTISRMARRYKVLTRDFLKVSPDLIGNIGKRWLTKTCTK